MCPLVDKHFSWNINVGLYVGLYLALIGIKLFSQWLSPFIFLSENMRVLLPLSPLQHLEGSYVARAVSGREEMPIVQGKKNPSKMVGAGRALWLSGEWLVAVGQHRSS